GVVGVACSAAPGAVGAAFTCSGTFAGAGMPLAGSSACIVFSLAPGAVVCSAVSGSGPAVAPPLPPPPPPPLLPPPLALVPPPPPFAPLGPTPSADARAVAGFVEVPVIPEADSAGLVLIGLLVASALGARRARRPGER